LPNHVTGFFPFRWSKSRVIPFSPPPRFATTAPHYPRLGLQERGPFLSFKVRRRFPSARARERTSRPETKVPQSSLPATEKELFYFRKEKVLFSSARDQTPFFFSRGQGLARGEDLSSFFCRRTRSRMCPFCPSGRCRFSHWELELGSPRPSECSVFRVAVLLSVFSSFQRKGAPFFP